MTTSVEEIRAAIEAANHSNASGPTLGIVPFLGERVESMHEPRFPNDGPIDGATLAQLLSAEFEMHEVAIDNARFDATVSTRGDDEIVMAGFFRGTFRHDGSELAHPVHIVWTVENGKIVRFWVDASTPEIMEGYQRQGEAFSSPEVRPYLDKLLAITGGGEATDADSAS
ncbi:MAG: nuclear transport factor 2 family protein [Acidimicrobiia bacterium]